MTIAYRILCKQTKQLFFFFFLEKRERNKNLTQVFSSRRNNFSMVYNERTNYITVRVFVFIHLDKCIHGHRFSLFKHTTTEAENKLIYFWLTANNKNNTNKCNATVGGGLKQVKLVFKHKI